LVAISLLPLSEWGVDSKVESNDVTTDLAAALQDMNVESTEDEDQLWRPLFATSAPKPVAKDGAPLCSAGVE
jgi:hypothetical protein